ncbi:MAG TPA: sulfur carrier protein ThiS [Rubricoccaceae bacterium]|jgi:sulfur carrier protein
MARIVLNGAPRDVPDGLTVEALLQHVGRDPAMPGVAVAVGDRVVRRTEWPATPVAEGDRVEVITAAQGG